MILHVLFNCQLRDALQAKDNHEKDLISKLPPDLVCKIVHEIFDEMVPTFQVSYVSFLFFAYLLITHCVCGYFFDVA